MFPRDTLSWATNLKGVIIHVVFLPKMQSESHHEEISVTLKFKEFYKMIGLYSFNIIRALRNDSILNTLKKYESYKQVIILDLILYQKLKNCYKGNYWRKCQNWRTNCSLDKSIISTSNFLNSITVPWICKRICLILGG